MELFKSRLFWIFAILALFLGLAVFASFWLHADLPSPDRLAERLNTPSVRIVDRRGRLLYEVLSETGKADSGRHAVMPLDAIPLSLRQATVATEDRYFYQNPGIDWRGLLRAIWTNLRGGEATVGGSTITQQVARNLLLTPEERSQRSIRRKLRELALAWQLTRRYTKDEILAFYLNQTYYGAMSYGVEAASQTYFGKPVSELDLAESALLAGLPQAPALYNPFTDLKAANDRQAAVLGLMEQAGFISAKERSQAEREPLVLAKKPYPIEAPHFVMMVRSQVDGLVTAEQIYQHGGLVVRTTLDLDWQKAAERAIERQMAALQHSADGLGHNVQNAALVALDPASGAILAMVGSPDFFDDQNGGSINMALSPRQPGSSLKPLVYAAAMDPARPHPWTAATMLLDVHTSFVTHDGQAYSPSNYDQQEHGPVLLRQALGSSLNIPAVLALDHIGMKTLFDLAKRLGIDTLGNPDDYDLSLALGGGEVRLLDLTAAYGAFANGGYRVTPYAIQEITGMQGTSLFTAQPAPQERVLDKRVTWLVSDMLSDNDARRLGFGPNTILRLDRKAAVKTGTTTNFHDNWTVGYTPDLVAGVWVGNTSYEPMREVSGLTGAAPVWHQFMRSVLTGVPEKDFPRPVGLLQVEVCALSGRLPTADCPYRLKEWFIEGTQPVEEDTFYKAVWVDRATGSLASQDGNAQPSQTAGDVERKVVLDLPSRAQPWARANGMTLLSDLIAQAAPEKQGSNAASQASSADTLRLAVPASHTVYSISPLLAREAQQIRLLAVGPGNLRRVTFWVDGKQIAQVETAPFQAWWALEPGQHQAWVEGVLDTGNALKSVSIQFEVK